MYVVPSYVKLFGESALEQFSWEDVSSSQPKYPLSSSTVSVADQTAACALAGAAMNRLSAQIRKTRAGQGNRAGVEENARRVSKNVARKRRKYLAEKVKTSSEKPYLRNKMGGGVELNSS